MHEENAQKISYRVLICGDRNWSHSAPIYNLIHLLNNNTLVIEGGARGADTMAGDIAHAAGLTVLKIMADWANKGRAAGPIRNREMLGESPNLVVGFHENIFDSKGTKHMIDISRNGGYPYMVIDEKSNIYMYGNLKQVWIDLIEKSNLFTFKERADHEQAE